MVTEANPAIEIKDYEGNEVYVNNHFIETAKISRELLEQAMHNPLQRIANVMMEKSGEDECEFYLDNNFNAHFVLLYMVRVNKEV